MPVSYFFMYFLFNIFNPIKMCKEKRKEKEFEFIKKKRCVLFDRKKKKKVYYGRGHIKIFSNVYLNFGLFLLRSEYLRLIVLN